MRKRTLVACLALTLSGCADYRPLPLGPVPEAPASPADVRIDASALPFPQLAAHRFDPSDGLDETEVAMLAVANNPDLRLARDDVAVAHAQSFAAGLLPDPQLALSRDLSNDSPGPGATKAFGVGLSYDINPLLQRVSGARAARADERKTSLTLLWQEWQVVSQARLLFVRLVHGQRLLRLLDAQRALLAGRVQRVAQARDLGLVTADTALTLQTGLQDLDKQLYDARRQARTDGRDLNILLGLAANAAFPLQEGGGAFAAAPTADAALADLPRRRPDLLALEAGYAAQDQRYRGAVLAQFPALNVGFTRARDSSDVHSNGIGITLSLPFLNRNRGNIAIEQATRQRLLDEYRQRVQASRAEIAALLAQRALDTAQLARARAAVVELQAALERSGAALRVGAVDALVDANARAALLARQVEQNTLEQQIAEQQVALQTLLGVVPGSAGADAQETSNRSPR